MSDRDEARLDRWFSRLEKPLPGAAARFVRWLRAPSSGWVRIPSGILLMFAGVFGALPILGMWMFPLGLLLLAQDIPPLKRWTVRALVRFERLWARRRRRRRRSGAGRHGADRRKEPQ